MIMILDALNTGEALTMFFLAGIIPGTNFSISATHMLEFFTLVLGFTLSRITLYISRLDGIRQRLTFELPH
jgi:hypothetical protein